MLDKRDREFVDTLHRDIENVMKDYGIDNRSSEPTDINAFIQDFTSENVTPTSPENDVWQDGEYRGWAYIRVPSKQVGLSDYDILMHFSKEGEENIFVVFGITPRYHENPRRYSFKFMKNPPAIVSFEKTYKVKMK